MPSSVDNTNSGQGDLHSHENDKTDDPSHSVQQARAGDASSLLIDNQHGSNSLANADDSHFHGNSNADGSHSASQSRVDGDHVVTVVNDGGVNIVAQADDGSRVHINTIHDGWVV